MRVFAAAGLAATASDSVGAAHAYQDAVESPPPDKATFQFSKEKLPVFGRYDVLVAGGGMAGFGAACAAARYGAKTLLVERLEQLGGLGSSGGVGNFSYGDDTLPGAQGKVLDDVWAGLEAMKAIGRQNGYHPRSNSLFHNHPFDHAILPFVLLEIALQGGVDLLFCSDIVGACIDGSHVTAAVIHNRSLLQAAEARVFIDGTGEGILARHAGARTLPADDPQHPDLIQPSHMIFLHKRTQPGFPKAFEEGSADRSVPNYSVWREPDRVGLKMKLYDRTFETGTGRGYSDTVIAFRRSMPRFVRHYQKKHDARVGFEFAAPMLGLREGRRVEGDYVLTGDDVRAGRRFDDGVAYATSCLDSHVTKEKVPPYQIPYRSLIASGVDNVLVAGRCFSGDRLALSSARVMATGCLMGQATGLAAAISCRSRLPIRDVEPTEIREQLIEGSKKSDLLKQRLAPLG
jgi:flavin-dependent dehydrogenase